MAWEGSNRRARLPANWRHRVREVKKRDPICRLCGIRPTTEVDHIIPGDDHSRLQGVCSSCHSQKSSREGVEARRRKRAPRRVERHPGRA